MTAIIPERREVASQPVADVLTPEIDRPVWIQVGSLVDGVSHCVRHDVHLVYNAREILYAGPANSPPSPRLLGPGQTRPSAVLADYTAVPGLIDAHVHLFLDGAPIDIEERKEYLKRPPEWLLDRSRDRLQKLLRTGVLAVRDAGDRDGVSLQLRDEYRARRSEPAERSGGEGSFAESSIADSPYIDSPGMAIHHRGRYGSFLGGAIEDYENAAHCVEARVRSGADRIKFMATGIINFKEGRVTTSPQISMEEASELVAAAGLYGLQTFAHASGSEGVENVVEAGVTSVEHGFFVTNDQLARMRDRQIAWVPTFAPVQVQVDFAAEIGWDNEVVGNLTRILDNHAESLRKAYAMGVPIVAGSDAGSCGVPHGIGFLYELELMELAGMPSLAVINAATGTSATMLNYREPIGRIETGCRARLIFTREDPLRTVRGLAGEKVIVFDGAVIDVDGPVDSGGL